MFVGHSSKRAAVRVVMLRLTSPAAVLIVSFLVTVRATTAEHLEVPTQPLKPLRILLAIAPPLPLDGTVSTEFSEALAEAEAILAPHLGREFRIDRTIAWRRVAPRDSLESLLLKLTSGVSRGDTDIVIGISRSPGRNEGISSYEEAYIALRTSLPIRELGPLLAHELGHVFGALHADDPTHLMAPRQTATDVDPLTSGFNAVTIPARSSSFAWYWSISSCGSP